MNTSGKRQVKAEARNANRHAVVLGGSLAGLLTARILSDHFERVTLIERDVYTENTKHAAAFRKRITYMGSCCAGDRFSKNFFPVCKTNWSQPERRCWIWRMRSHGLRPRVGALGFRLN